MPGDRKGHVCVVLLYEAAGRPLYQRQKVVEVVGAVT